MERDRYNELMLALIIGNEEEARNIIMRDKNQVTWTNTMGHTSLHFAALFGSPSIIQLLLDNGAMINCMSLGTPVAYAAIRRNPEALIFLIRKGALIDPSCWKQAITRGNEGTIYILLTNGAGISASASLHDMLQLVKEPMRSRIERIFALFGFPIDRSRKKTLFPHPLERAAILGETYGVRQLLYGSAWRILSWVPHFIKNYFQEPLEHYSPEQLGRALACALCRVSEIEDMLIDAGARFYDAEDVLKCYLELPLERLVPRMTRTKIIKAEREFSTGIRTGAQGQPSYMQLLPGPVFENVIRYLNGRAQTFEQREREGDNEFEGERIRALFAALARENNARMGERLIEDQIRNPNLTDDQGCPILASAFHLHPPVAQRIVAYLLKQGAYPNPETRQGCFFDYLTRLPSEILAPRLDSLDTLLAEVNPRTHVGLHIRRAFFRGPREAYGIIYQLLSQALTKEHEWQIDLVYEYLLNESNEFIGRNGPVIDLLLMRKPHLTMLLRNSFRNSPEKAQQKVAELLQRFGTFPRAQEHIALFYQLLTNVKDDVLYDYREMIRTILQRFPYVVVQQRLALLCKSHGQSARLLEAVRNGALVTMAQALDLGIDPNTVTIGGNSLLEYCVLHHRSEDRILLKSMIKLLLSRGANPNPEKRQEGSLFDRLSKNHAYQCFIEDRLSLITQVLDAAEKKEKKYTQLRLRLNGNAAFINALRHSDINSMMKILEDGINLNTIFIDGSPVIEYMALHHPNNDLNKIKRMIMLLLHYGAGGNPSRDEESELLFARLVNDPAYRHFITERALILLHLLDEVEQRGIDLYPQLRMRLQAVVGVLAPPRVKINGLLQ
jgi:ankyrin repeat protein